MSARCRLGWHDYRRVPEAQQPMLSRLEEVSVVWRRDRACSRCRYFRIKIEKVMVPTGPSKPRAATSPESGQ